MVDELVRAKLESGQLDECPLTLQELAEIRKSFTNTLRSMMHSRIDYPKDDDSNGPLTYKPTAGQDLSSHGRVIEMPKRASSKGAEPEDTKKSSGSQGA